MAIIYTYPRLINLQDQDLLLISDTSSKRKDTMRVELGDLANFLITSKSIITGGGTENYVPIFDATGSVIVDSQLQQSPQLSSGLYQMRFNNADRFIINKPSSITSGDPEYLIQQDGNYKVSFGWDDDGGGFGFIYNWAGNGLRLGAQGQNPQFELNTVVPKIISHTDHEFEGAILDVNGLPGTVGQRLSSTGTGVEWINDGGGTVTGAGTTNSLPIWSDGPNGVLGDSIIYQDADGHVGVGVPGSPPNPRHKFEVYDLRDENNAFDYSVIVSSDINSPFNQGTGGIKNQLSLDGGSTYPYAISLVAGTTSSELMASTKLAFYANSDLNTSSATGFSGFVVHNGTNPFWQLGGGVGDATPSTTLKVVGAGEFTDQLAVGSTVNFMSSTYLFESGGAEFSASLDMQSNKIYDLPDPIDPQDAATKAYVDSKNTPIIINGLVNNLASQGSGGYDFMEFVSNVTGPTQIPVMKLTRAVRLVGVGFVWMGDTALSIGAGEQVEFTIGTIPSGSNPIIGNYTSSGVLFTLDSSVSGTWANGNNSGLTIDFNAGDIIAVVGQETGTVTPNTGELGITLEFITQ